MNAFIDPEKEGSNSGKLAIADYGLTLFAQSPIVGFGQRRFSEISAPLGNTRFTTSQTHSFALSTLLSSGLIGLAAYSAITLVLLMALWRKKGPDYSVLFGLFLGLNTYNLIYDAGGLDVFACFNGLVACYALDRPERSAPQPVRGLWRGRP
jgi:O-antigen ligase